MNNKDVQEPGNRIAIIAANPCERLIARPAGRWKHSHSELASGTLGGRECLLVSLRHSEDDPERMQADIWLPPAPVEVAGEIRLDFFGTGSGAQIYLDCLDNGEWGLRYLLGSDDREGWQQFSASAENVTRGLDALESRKRPSGSLCPARICIEDARHRRNLALGIGALSVAGYPAPVSQWGGSLQLSHPAGSIALDALQGKRRLLARMQPGGLLAAGADGELHALGCGTAHGAGGTVTCTLLNGGELAQIELRQEQVTSVLWEYAYRLRFVRDADLELLVMRGELPLIDTLGAEVLSEEGETAKIDGVLLDDATLLEVSVWDSVSWGGSGSAPLTVRFDGDTIKTMRLIDLRHDSGRPAYAIEAVLGEREHYRSGSELSFQLRISTEL